MVNMMLILVGLAFVGLILQDKSNPSGSILSEGRKLFTKKGESS